MKNTDMPYWVGTMNTIKQQAEGDYIKWINICVKIYRFNGKILNFMIQYELIKEKM